MAQVGIVSSVAMPTGAGTLHSALTTPLAAHTIVLEHANGNYDANSKREMKKAVKRLFNSPAPDFNLVIAVGGLVAARAVSDFMDSHDNKDAPFLICVGRAPNEGSTIWDNEQFMGGINLDTANQNTLRATHLKRKYPAVVTSINQVCLYYNRNSHMAAREAKDWSFFGLLKESSVDHTATDAEIATQFGADFSSMPRGTKAVIVSSDPFFASKPVQITDAARTQFGGPVCFPNTVFNRNPQPNFVFYGADLMAAYADLGAKAAALLALPRPKNMGLDTPIPVLTNNP